MIFFYTRNNDLKNAINHFDFIVGQSENKWYYQRNTNIYAVWFSGKIFKVGADLLELPRAVSDSTSRHNSVFGNLWFRKHREIDWFSPSTFAQTATASSQRNQWNRNKSIVAPKWVRKHADISVENCRSRVKSIEKLYRQIHECSAVSRNINSNSSDAQQMLTNCYNCSKNRICLPKVLAMARKVFISRGPARTQTRAIIVISILKCVNLKHNVESMYTPE